MKLNKETVSALHSVRVARVPLSSAQLLSLNTSPVKIIPAPGANKLIVVTTSIYRLFFGTIRYSVEGNALFYDGYIVEPADTGDAGIFHADQDGLHVSSTGIGITAVGGLPVSTFINKAIVLTDPGGDMTDGDGTGEIVVYYVIADLSRGS